MWSPAARGSRGASLPRLSKVPRASAVLPMLPLSLAQLLSLLLLLLLLLMVLFFPKERDHPRRRSGDQLSPTTGGRKETTSKWSGRTASAQRSRALLLTSLP
nr:hypothetical protein [Pandoravirus massiliensis]